VGAGGAAGDPLVGDAGGGAEVGVFEIVPPELLVGEGVVVGAGSTFLDRPGIGSLSRVAQALSNSDAAMSAHAAALPGTNWRTAYGAADAPPKALGARDTFA
jgi:hypothetical protein